jgi:hypothetical protein
VNGVTLPGAGPAFVWFSYQRLAVKLISIINDKDEERGEHPLFPHEVEKPDNVPKTRKKKKL